MAWFPYKSLELNHQFEKAHDIFTDLINLLFHHAIFLQIGFYIGPMQDNMYRDQNYEYHPNPFMHGNEKMS